MRKAKLFTGALLLLLTLPGHLIAGVDPPVVQVLNGSQGQLFTGATATVEDAKFFDPTHYNLLKKPHHLVNAISLELNEDANLIIPNDLSTGVNITINYMLSDSTTHSTGAMDLGVSYNERGSYNHRHTFVLYDAVRVEVVVNTLDNDTKQFLKLINQLQSFPVYDFSCTESIITDVHDSTWAPNTTNDELPVYWETVIGADEYDLEWAYVDSSAFAGGLYGDTSSLDPDLIFDNNASRITITGTIYHIPLLYDNKGHLFFRVRPVQWLPGGGRKEAAWSTVSMPDGLGRFDFNGHERSLNWQATTTFAEDGKRKSVVQYYDGSLRARQTVTKDNSTNTTIVAESFYDYQGRPVIQVLPAPTLNTVIGYTQNFNRGLNGDPYDKSLYDTLASPDMYCSTGAPAMDTSSGASQYYSPDNPLHDSVYHKFIPDAEGYPFTEVEYTQDNTGRISRQSGVGDTFRLGSNRETKYFYGTPDQREMDALFGTEVGDNSHYFKTMVRDANGQYSVSYTDMRGRTVATALAGAPPLTASQNDTLSSYTSATRTEVLADPASVVIKDLVMEHKKGLLVPVAGNHSFTYSLDTLKLKQEGCASEQICYTCLYDLEIIISDDCNNQKIGQDGKPFDTTFQNFSIGSIDTACSSGNGFTVQFTKYLPEGSYEITKKLTVSRYGQDYYRDSVFLPANTCKTLDSFLLEQRQIVAAIQDCEPSCAKCEDSVGLFEDFRERFIRNAGIDSTDSASYRNMAMEAWIKAKEDCAALCDSVSDADDVRTAMLLDMTPSSGQYANVDNSQDLLSVFYFDTTITDEDYKSNYRLVTNYKDENGEPDLVYDERLGTLVPPQQLSPEQFAQKFKSSWAESLLPYHPEYCKLWHYELLQNSHKWDRRFEATDTYAEALANGYLNPIGYAPFTDRFGTSFPDKDPLDTAQGNHFQTDLRNAIGAYRTISGFGSISMWGVACITVKCAGADGDCFTIYQDTANVFNTGLMCTGELDMAWRAFRQLYLNEKRRLENEWLDSQCGSPSATDLIEAGHLPHFGDAEELLAANGIDVPTDATGANALKSAQEGQADSYYDANCRAYASLWLQQLGTCALYPPEDIETVIIPQLIQVCKEGADMGHPYGSSTVRPGSVNTYKSFEEVIESYNQSHHITDAAHCNAYTITAPKPYDQQLIYSNKPIYTAPDSCECATITSYYNKYQSATGSFTSFSDYLQQVYQTTMTDSVLNLLLSFCHVGDAPDPECAYVSAPIDLPPVFQCYSGDICVDCIRFNTLYTQYLQKFPGAIPAYNDADSAQQTVNTLFEAYMNYKLGFVKSTREYLDFMNGCQLISDSTTAYDTATVSCNQLQQFLDEFYFKGINPDSRRVDLNMRTFLGNVTPREGPKGVFDINETFIANTVDGTPEEIDSSFADIWNSSTVNQAVGTLSPLPNGKFRLQLNPGQQAPCKGVTGLRYYQFDISIDSLDAIRTGAGCYVNFGDGHELKVVDIPLGSHTYISRSIGPAGVQTPFLEDLSSFIIYKIRHFYTSDSARTVTIYHSDGFTQELFFDCSFTCAHLANLKNLRGYMPEQLISLGFHSTKDSTLNRTSEIQNFDKVHTIQLLDVGSGGGTLYWENNNLGSLAANHDMRSLWIDNTRSVPVAQLKPLREYVPNLPLNFPKLNFVQIRPYDSVFAGDLDVSLPRLRYFTIECTSSMTSTQIDRFIHQIATTSVMDTGVLNIYNTPVERTSASDADIATLAARHWYIRVGAATSIGTDLPHYTPPPPETDSIGYYNEFVDFINAKFGTDLTLLKVIALYNRKCGSAPDFCAYTPDSVTTTLKKLKADFVNQFYNHGIEYDPDGCDVSTWTVNHSGTLENTTGIPHKEIFKNGIMQLPDTLTNPYPHNQVDYDFIDKDSACINGHMSMEIRLKDTIAAWQTYNHYIFDLYFGRNPTQKYYINFDHFDTHWNYVQTVGDPLGAQFVFDISELQQDYYTNWRTIKFEIADSLLKVYLDGSLIKTLTFSGIFRDKFYGFTLASAADSNLSAKYDWVKCYDGNGKLFYFEDFSSCSQHSYFAPYIHCDQQTCTDAFTAWFNQQQETSYTYSQLDSLYTSHDIPLDVCTSATANLTLCGRATPAFPRIALDTINNCTDSAFFIVSKAQELYNAYTDSLKQHFDSAYAARCLQAYKMETFTVRHTVSEFHYTLYYYDQAGNLVKTVPPEGVHANYDSLWLDDVKTARLAGTTKVPEHTLITQYRYNTLNQVVSQQSPDGGKTDFWYDRLGRLVLSRNARQLAASTSDSNYYSYTRYDGLDRITEVGQLYDTSATTPIVDSFTRNEAALDNWFASLEHSRDQVTNTVYDIAYNGFGAYDGKLVLQQKNLRNRVSYVNFVDTPGISTAYNNATFYSYDIHGNVDTLLQDYGQADFVPNLMNTNGNRFKKFIYQYDLISGKVNMVMYQRGWADQWFHRYSYDAENRLTMAETSADSLMWEKDASYEYYKHGPLARTVLGQQQVQGLDYAYTLQGWLKGVNSTGGTETHDMGKDGKAGDMNQYTARDAYAFTLNYFAGDYKPIGANVVPFPHYSGFLGALGHYRPLYNGNISSMSEYNKKFDTENFAWGGLQLYSYRYDQLNRLTGQDAHIGFDTANNNWENMDNMGDFMTERISYDGNGNILRYLRNAMSGNSTDMDSLTYSYYPGTNKLKHVRDFVDDDAYHSSNDDILTDIDDQQEENNYEYDAIGNMTADHKEGISNIKWSVYGKILEVTREATDRVPVTTIKYSYDASGNRISKVFDVGGQKQYTWYARDAQGNILSTYASIGNGDLPDLDLTQAERYIFGSSRLGMYVPEAVDVDNSQAGPAEVSIAGGQFVEYKRGYRQYELTNHLGNVLATITDKKFGVPSDTNSSFTGYYEPEIIGAFGYYPFGAMSRIYASNEHPNYRFGFNGKELDHEAKGSSNQYDYGMRIYDPRLGRFLSVDPITRQYPELTPYQYASNRPIDGIDLDGLEYANHIFGKYEYDGSLGWFDFLKAIPNAAANIGNGAIDIYNSAASNVVSVSKGTWVKDVKKDFTQLGKDIKQDFSNSWTYASKTPATKQVKEMLPRVLETGLTIWGASKFIPTKGNLLTPEGQINVFKNSATKSAVVNSGTLTIPQGLTAEQFTALSERLASKVGQISNDIVVQGSRASGTASIASDIDIAIKVSAQDFEALINKAFGKPNLGSAKWKTMQHAIETGKIQAGEAGLRSFRLELEKLLGMDVDVSVIKKGGQFDNGAQIPVQTVKTN